MPSDQVSKLTSLRLVYPPVSNQEAFWIKDDPAVVDRIRQSDFYMIAARAEITFSNFVYDEAAMEISFSVALGGEVVDSATLCLEELPGIVGRRPDDLWIETGEKMVRIADGPVESAGTTVLEWYTTEKLLWNRSHGSPGIKGLDSYRKFTEYDLLYVGIAKVGDTYDRLFANGHKARTEILANEGPRCPGSRVADETYLFLYRLSPLLIHTLITGDFDADALGAAYERKRVVADAEKAFVSLLKPEYNLVRFKSYPRGADGLYESGFVRYGYVIGENLAFNTSHGRFSGGWDSRMIQEWKCRQTRPTPSS
jgi:hypothetical protein